MASAVEVHIGTTVSLEFNTSEMLLAEKKNQSVEEEEALEVQKSDKSNLSTPGSCYLAWLSNNSISGSQKKGEFLGRPWGILTSFAAALERI